VAKGARIAICSLAGDLHALRVWEALVTRDGVACYLIETDRLVGRPLTWESAQFECASLPALGGAVRVDSLHAIWWRRVGRPQHAGEKVGAVARDVVNGSWQAALLGVLRTAFHGAWVSLPDETAAAEGKLLQLRVAKDVGLPVPETLVTTDPERLRAFIAELSGEVVVKPLKDTRLDQLATLEVTAEMLAHEPSVKMAPAIWQRKIIGRHHLRVCVFGSQTIAVLLTSDHLDWRRDPNLRATAFSLDNVTCQRLGDMLARLGIRMGVFDFKIDEDGSLWWLELNPQGQFLFLENLAHFDLLTPFCEFLLDEARR
jgi:hypothetical protein